MTLEGEQVLAAARAEHGGELTRLELSHAEPLGGFTAWRAAAADRAVERPQGGRVTVHFIGAGPGAADLLTLRGGAPDRVLPRVRLRRLRSCRPRCSGTRPQAHA